jgi:hypothetical protein
LHEKNFDNLWYVLFTSNYSKDGGRVDMPMIHRLSKEESQSFVLLQAIFTKMAGRTPEATILTDISMAQVRAIPEPLFRRNPREVLPEIMFLRSLRNDDGGSL